MLGLKLNYHGKWAPFCKTPSFHSISALIKPSCWCIHGIEKGTLISNKWQRFVLRMNEVAIYLHGYQSVGDWGSQSKAELQELIINCQHRCQHGIYSTVISKTDRCCWFYAKHLVNRYLAFQTNHYATCFETRSFEMLLFLTHTCL